MDVSCFIILFDILCTYFPNTLPLHLISTIMLGFEVWTPLIMPSIHTRNCPFSGWFCMAQQIIYVTSQISQLTWAQIFANLHLPDLTSDFFSLQVWLFFGAARIIYPSAPSKPKHPATTSVALSNSVRWALKFQRELGNLGQWIWSNYSDLTRVFTPNGGLVREFPLFQGNLGWWNIIIWPEWMSLTNSPLLEQLRFIVSKTWDWWSPTSVLSCFFLDASLFMVLNRNYWVFPKIGVPPNHPF